MDNCNPISTHGYKTNLIDSFHPKVEDMEILDTKFSYLSASGAYSICLNILN